MTIEQLSTGAGWKYGLYNTTWQNRLGIFPKFFVDWRLPKTDLVDRVSAIRPQIIHGPPSVLSWIADELTAEDRERIRPGLLMSGGETCTAAMRRQIERGFGAPLAEVYGSHEFVGIAARGPEESEYGVYGGITIAEVLKEEGEPALAGEEGEFVGTALHSFAMPFLRYRLGDLVRRGASADWHRNSCSRLSGIMGRTVDRFRLASGEYVHPFVIARRLRDEERWLRRFQIIQRGPNEVWIRIVPYVEPGGRVLEELARKVSGVFPEAVQIRIDLVEELPPTSSGKFHPYVSWDRFRSWGERPAPPDDCELWDGT